jgi:hypothetical protein
MLPGEARASLAVAAIGTKVLFAGGQVPGQGDKDIVNIYETATGVWSMAKLSGARRNMEVLTTGGKVYSAAPWSCDPAQTQSSKPRSRQSPRPKTGCLQHDKMPQKGGGQSAPYQKWVRKDQCRSARP